MSELSTSKTKVVTVRMPLEAKPRLGQQKTDIPTLKKKVSSILDKVPGKQSLPEWDQLYER